MINDEQLQAQLNNWTSGKKHDEPLNTIDLAARVRALKAVRVRRKRTITLASAVVLAALGLSASYFSFQKAQYLSTAHLVVGNDNREESEVTSNTRLTQQHLELSADIEQTQFQVELLAMNIRVQQVIAKADHLLLECDRQASQEKQASQWLAAALNEMPVDGGLK